MALSKKHFDQLAAILKEHNDVLIAKGMITGERHPEDTGFALCTRMAFFCETQNPKFDHDRFMEACGYNDAP